jgi:HprK-related kinase A
VTPAELTDTEIAHRLRTSGLAICCGPFIVRITSPIPAVAEGISLLYADYPLPESDDFADFHLVVAPPFGLRRWVRRQVVFTLDGFRPFEPLPIAHAYPLFEWALNWCIANVAHQYLILHAAVIERHGRAVILPGPPMSGKSTLCAGLVSRGWRLLSDELTLIGTEDHKVAPVPRPISLKNESLDVIRNFVPGVVFNSVTHDTAKGTVTHMKVPVAHIRRAQETAVAGWVVFPKYIAGAAATLTSRKKADSMMQLGRNAFNYGLLGQRGFDALGDVVEASEIYDFQYSDLNQAVAVFDRLCPPGVQ